MQIEGALRVAILVVAAGGLTAACGGDGSDARTDGGVDAGTDAGTDAATCAWGRSDAGACDDAVEISSAAAHSCARRRSGAVVCWGSNPYGELGDGTMSHLLCSGVLDCSPNPVAVSALTEAVALDVGEQHTCAVRATGTVACWGANAAGQLGDGTLSHSMCHESFSDIDCSLTPVAVSGLTDVVEVSVGSAHTCARRTSGTVVCWGRSSEGALGDGAPSAFRCAGGAYCALTPVTVVGLADAVEISAGSDHTCARRASGSVVCWGDNFFGQLGDGTRDPRRAPVAVSGLVDVVEISAALGTTCARRASGTVVCWGDNQQGQLGDGTFVNRTTPVAVLDLTEAVEISAGGVHTCARRATGAVSCWGDNGTGALGDGTTVSRPTTAGAVVGVTDAVEITGGRLFGCARRASGVIVCWGSAEEGRLGDGSITGFATTPVPVSAPTP